MKQDRALLAVDLGLRSGLALYNAVGGLVWYRSQNFGAKARLKRAVYRLFQEHPAITHVVLEGGGDLGIIWRKEAERRGLEFEQIHAERWRRELLLQRQQRSGAVAKGYADRLARQVIAWSGASKPTSLRHDADEAILIGLWGVWRYDWIEELPI